MLNRLSVKSKLALSAYTPLQLPNAKWAMVAEMDLAEVMQPIVWQQRPLLIATVILALVVILVAIVLSNLFVRPVDALVVGAQDITAGKQEVEVQLTSQDVYERTRDLYSFAPHADIDTSKGTGLAVWALQAATDRAAAFPHG